MGRKKAACLICASIKAACSKDHPCRRCRRLSLCCTYAHDHDKHATQDPIVDKAFRSRSRAGCVVCRRKKKKCDEQQPVCGDCERLGLDCQYREVVKSLPLPAASISPSTNNTAEGPGTWTTEISSLLAADDLSPVAGWIELIVQEDLAALHKPTSLNQSAALVDLPVPCAIKDEVNYATFLPPTALMNLIGVTVDNLRSWTLGERHLLNHFLSAVSRALVVAEDKDNPFLRIIVPMALENDMVRHSLMALSASHLSAVYPSYMEAMLLHRSLALKALKSGLTDRRLFAWALAATLLLCLCEVSSRHTLLVDLER